MKERYKKGEKNQAFRRGIVKEVDAAKARVRVTFDDEDENTSFWLNVNQAASAGAKNFWMPDVGGQVNCLVDWDGEDGTVIGAVYSQKNPPPTSDGNHIMTEMKDGSVFKFDQGSSTLTITIGGSDVTITPGEILLKNGGSSVSITAGEIKLQAPIININ